MTSHPLALAIASVTLLASIGDAQITTASYNIGGPNSCANTGFNDPGLLNDGATQGRAKFNFTLDGSTNVLTLRVWNTSPIVPGECNPIITQIWFTASPLLDRFLIPTGIVASGGAAPFWSFTWDNNLFDMNNPNHVDGFGLSSGRLFSRRGLDGGIANQAADTHALPLNQFMHGPVTFSFVITGSLLGNHITADAFEDWFTLPGMGEKPVHGAATFAGGGPSCTARGNIGDGTEDCYIVRGDARGNDPFASPGPTYHVFPTQIASHRDHFGVTMEGPLYLPLGNFSKKVGMPGKQLVDSFCIEVLMWNPTAFPLNPEQNSAGYDVKLFDDGSARVKSFGLADGIEFDWEIVESLSGKPFISFPFTIQG